jgi:hypothetical protein
MPGTAPPEGERRDRWFGCVQPGILQFAKPLVTHTKGSGGT